MPGDSVELQQVLINLVMNAMDSIAAVPLGERLVAVVTRARGGAVEIIVKDTRPGIGTTPPMRLFDPVSSLFWPRNPTCCQLARSVMGSVSLRSKTATLILFGVACRSRLVQERLH